MNSHKTTDRSELPNRVPPAQRVPRLLSFLATHLAMGVAVGVVFAALTILSNTAGLKVLLEGSSEPYLAMFLLFFMCALTFGSAAMGVAVMTLPLERPDDFDDQSAGEKR